MNPKRWLTPLMRLFLLCAPLTALSQAPRVRVNATEAKEHIGHEATVCGRVASTRYAVTSRGKPTFLNLDKPYPAQVFTILIWGESRDKFGVPEEKYRDKRVCVTGKITEYRGAPEVVVSDPQNIEVQK